MEKDLIIFKDGASKYVDATEMCKGMVWDGGFNAYIVRKFDKLFKWHRDAWFEV